LYTLGATLVGRARPDISYNGTSRADDPPWRHGPTGTINLEASHRWHFNSGANTAVYRVVAGIAMLLLTFWGALLLLNSGADKQPIDPDACPGGETSILTRPYSRLDGYAYKAALPSLASLSDTDANLTFSPALMCENKLVLGPPHTAHAEIARDGWGRFSHYGDSVIFSSSDYSDPNSNGRQYTIVVPSKRR
jgi:hypothetical protein